MRRNNKHIKEKEKKIVRCRITNRPMFEYETCFKFELRESASPNAQQNCKNCLNSF